MTPEIALCVGVQGVTHIMLHQDWKRILIVMTVYMYRIVGLHRTTHVNIVWVSRAGIVTYREHVSRYAPGNDCGVGVPLVEHRLSVRPVMYSLFGSGAVVDFDQMCEDVC